MDKVTFTASFPAIQSAIKIAGDGTGMRIMLEIPENQMIEAVKLMLYRQCAFTVTIEPYEQKTQTATTGDAANGDRPVKRTTAKQRDR